MQNIIKKKYLGYIEWVVRTPAKGTTLSSEAFAVRGCNCHLELRLQSYCLSLLLRNHGNNGSVLAVRTRLISPSIDSTPRTVYMNVVSANYIWKRNLDLRNRELTFEVIIHRDPVKCSFSTLLTSGSSIEETDGNQVPFKSGKSIHFEALSRDFSNLLTENSSCDVQIICDGKSFKAHRAILRSRSEVFSRILNSKMIEGKTGRIKVEGIQAPVFEYFLRYLYSATLPKLNLDTAKQFYKVGDKYAVHELKKAGSEFLIKNLSVGNACQMLVLADQHSDDQFREDVMSYIVKEKIPQHYPNWSIFCKSNPFLAIEVQNLYIKQHCPK